VRRVAALLLAALAAPPLATAQTALDRTATFKAESLRLAGRPWHAAETMLAAAARDSHPNAFLVVEGAKAEVHARRFDRARGLLAGQPWLEDYAGGEALAVLGQAENGLGQYTAAAEHFSAARARASGARAALLAVRAGLAHEAAGQPDSAARAFAAARAGGLQGIDAWLRVRQARVSRDTAEAFRLLADAPAAAAREVMLARARAVLLAGDTARALDAFAQAGKGLDVARLALAVRDSTRARGALYELMARAPQSDDAAAAVALALGPLPPRAPAEHVALGRALNRRTTAADARIHVEHAIRLGDSSAATLVFYAELLVATGRYAEAARAYRAAATDSALGPLAIYRRARVLVRLDDPGATTALSGFAQTYPSDTAAPTALYVLGDALFDRGDWAGAARWFGELIARYPSDTRSSLARFRLAARAYRDNQLDSAAALYQGEVMAAGPQRTGARFWLGRIAQTRGDSAGARDIWRALARDDSLGYYGLRARRETDMPRVAVPVAAAPPGIPTAVINGLARLDTLMLAGLDSEAQLEVRAVLGRPPQDVESLLAWSEGLGLRGFGSAAVRLGWQAFVKAPGEPRVLRAIYPWPARAAVEAEAKEFAVDPLLLVAIIRQESVFDVEALSPAGARGLAQLTQGTAALTARGLDVTFYPEWITVPDLNLHLGAAHLAELLRRFGRLETAIAAYNAGGSPVRRWLERDGADDPDQFIELIPYPETRGYVRSVMRNRELYRILYTTP
jgi:soluble lytic murein transglycosylase